LSEYLTEDGESIEVGRARDIANFAVENESAHTAFVAQLFHHLVKQAPGAFRPGALQDLRLQFEQKDFNIQTLMSQMALLATTYDLNREPTPNP